jgi:enoyl-CoA hydratase
MLATEGLAMAETLLTVERHGRVLRLGLNRPAQRNALSLALVQSLGEQVAQAADDAAIGAVLITATGPAFSAGADLGEALSFAGDGERFRHYLRDWKRVYRSLELLDKPVIAAVQGLAIAGGLELALSCDFIIAAASARFGDGHITYGLVPGGGGTQRLPAAVGVRHARRLMYSADLVGATEAAAMGLVSLVLPDEDFDASATSYAAAVATRSTPALAFMKTLSRDPLVTDEGLDEEIRRAVDVVIGPDTQEGLRAFSEKRPPRFPSVVGS